MGVKSKVVGNDVSDGAWCVGYTFSCFVLQAEDGIRNSVESRWLGDMDKRQEHRYSMANEFTDKDGKLQQWVTTVSYKHLTLPTIPLV